MNKDRAVLMFALRTLRAQANYLASVAEGACRVAEEDDDDALAPAFAQMSADFTGCSKQAAGLLERLARKDPAYETH